MSFCRMLVSASRLNFALKNDGTLSPNFSRIFPTNPSHTITSTTPLRRSRPSTFPAKFSVLSFRRRNASTLAVVSFRFLLADVQQPDARVWSCRAWKRRRSIPSGRTPAGASPCSRRLPRHPPAGTGILTVGMSAPIVGRPDTLQPAEDQRRGGQSRRRCCPR